MMDSFENTMKTQFYIVIGIMVAILVFLGWVLIKILQHMGVI